MLALRSLLLLMFVLQTSCAITRNVINEWNRIGERNQSEVHAKRFVIEKKWVRSTVGEEYLGFRTENSMSPLLHGDQIIQGNSIDGIVAMRRSSGNLVWERRLPTGVSANGQIWDQTLYVGSSDGNFYALDTKTGSVRWKYAINSEGIGAPRVENNRVFFIAGNSVLYALDATSGQLLWQYNRRDQSMLSIFGASRPTIEGKSVFAGFSDGFVVSLDKSTGNLLWERKINANKKFRDADAEPIVEGSRVYVGGYDSGLYCLDKGDGKIIWKTDTGSHSAPVLTPKSIYLSTSDGKVLSLEKSSGSQQWSYSLKHGLATQPLLFRGLVIFGESSADLVALDATTGKFVGSYSSGRGIKATPTLDSDSGDLYFMSVSANLFSVRLTWKTPGEVWAWE